MPHSEYLLRRGASLENAKDWLRACVFQYLALSDNKERFNELMERINDNDDWAYEMFDGVLKNKNSNKSKLRTRTKMDVYIHVKC